MGNSIEWLPVVDLDGWTSFTALGGELPLVVAWWTPVPAPDPGGTIPTVSWTGLDAPAWYHV